MRLSSSLKAMKLVESMPMFVGFQVLKPLDLEKKPHTPNIP